MFLEKNRFETKKLIDENSVYKLDFLKTRRDLAITIVWGGNWRRPFTYVLNGWAIRTHSGQLLQVAQFN